MLDALFQLAVFFSKALIVVVLILVLFAGLLALLGRGKEKINGKIRIKNLNEKLAETTNQLLEKILSKKKLKNYLKEKKEQEKIKKQADEKSASKNVFVIDFQGDIKASAVTALREEVTAILGIIKDHDEVIVRLESPGGMVHAYGLAAAQLQRFKQRNILLTICVDKVAASGGYMMACVADKILAAPFAMIGSIGVIVQLPNFHRLLKEKNIDFEQLTAGNYKRTITMFGQNTEEGREKLREEIEEIHLLFKKMIHENRPQLDIEKVATGEHWLAKQALEFQLVDELKTSDDYILEKSKEADVYELTFMVRKSLGEKLFSASSAIKSAIQSF